MKRIISTDAIRKTTSQTCSPHPLLRVSKFFLKGTKQMRKSKPKVVIRVTSAETLRYLQQSSKVLAQRFGTIKPPFSETVWAELIRFVLQPLLIALGAHNPY